MHDTVADANIISDSNSKKETKVAVTYLKRHENDHPEREQLAHAVADHLKKHFAIESRLVNLKDFPSDPDFNGIVMAVGGDGVLLGSTYAFTNKENRFILIGTAGKSAAFYAQTDYSCYRDDMKRILDGGTGTLQATRVRVETGDGSYHSPDTLNEIAFKERNTGQMFSYDMEIEGNGIYKRSQGGCSTIIFATPCGSTAWGLAAGGSIIYGKDSRQVAITPESPVNSIKADPYNQANMERDRYSLLAPGIFPLECSIRFTPLVDTVLIKDGRWWENDVFPAGTEFHVKPGHPLQLIRLNVRGFIRT